MVGVYIDVARSLPMQIQFGTLFGTLCPEILPNDPLCSLSGRLSVQPVGR